MSRSRTDISQVADRYAKALFALAEEGAREAVEADMAALAAAIRADNETQAMLAHPLLSREAKAKALVSLLKTKKAQALTLQAVEKIARAGRVDMLADIAEAFVALCVAARGEVVAVVTSARALNKKEADAVAKALKDATGHAVRVEWKQDASLLGGLKVSLAAKELDMSVAGKLERMRRALVAA